MEYIDNIIISDLNSSNICGKCEHSKHMKTGRKTGMVLKCRLPEVTLTGHKNMKGPK